LKEGREVYVGDPNLVSSSRITGVLKLAVEKAGWGNALGPGRGKGIAVCPYGTSYCAVVAEVTVRDEKVTVDKVTLAVDCGRVVNPSGASNQLVGGIVWSLTALFYGGLPIRNGRAVQNNFHQNKLLRMNECPPVEVHFVDSQEERPGGIGEISSPLGVPAALNAIFAATGKRVRKIPLSIESLKV
jgi:CO/xanthine dehydrogenase Mo-binding subunit